jgi:hypothetical protein
VRRTRAVAPVVGVRGVSEPDGGSPRPAPKKEGPEKGEAAAASAGTRRAQCTPQRSQAMQGAGPTGADRQNDPTATIGPAARAPAEFSADRAPGRAAPRPAPSLSLSLCLSNSFSPRAACC